MEDRTRQNDKFKVDTITQATVTPADTFHRMFGNVVKGWPDSYASGHGGQKQSC